MLLLDKVSDSCACMSEEKVTVNWSSAAARLGERYGSAFVPEVEAFLKRARNDRVLVACSGGADSVFMLLLLVAQAESLGVDLVVAHYNHRWRADASDADAVFVEALAKAFSLTYIAGVRPENEAAFTETTARALRLDFLRQAAAQQKCVCIAFGHQLDDILETQIQRIARGSGSEGLAAPRPIARFSNLPTHVRPLLALRSVDIRMALNSLDVPWCQDDSNDDYTIARNALRGKVIPDLIEVLNRDPAIGAARSRRLLEEDSMALEHMAQVQLPLAYTGQTILDRRDLRSAPRALTRRALMAWLNTHGLIASVGAPTMDLLLNEIYSAKKKYKVSVGCDFIVMDADTLRIDFAHEVSVALSIEPSTLEPGTSLLLATGAVMELNLVELDEAKLASIFCGEIDPGKEAYLLPTHPRVFDVRGWLPGDRFKPLGAPGTKKLKDWFIDRHIPQKERKQLPIVINSTGEILWVPGFPPADALKIRRNTKLALRLTYQTRNPPSLA